MEKPQKRVQTETVEDSAMRGGHRTGPVRRPSDIRPSDLLSWKLEEKVKQIHSPTVKKKKP